MMIDRRKLLSASAWLGGPLIARTSGLLTSPAAAQTVALRSTLTVPALNIVDAPLSDKIPVAGYICKSSADGKQLFFEYKIGLDDPNAGDQDKSVIANLGPHTVTVKDAAGTTVATFNLPKKQARTHWRYPALTSQVIHTPKWLVDNNFMFPFAAPGFRLTTVKPVTYAGPNGFAGLTRAMGTTGERPDIGIVTEWTAKYMMDGDPANVLITAEVASNAPMFFIDKNTGKPVDKLKYSKANNYGGGPHYRGSPWFQPSHSDYGDPVDVWPDIAHMPEISYIAALITEDRWHLFNLQGWVENALLTDADSTPDGTGPVIFAPSITREFAWGLRTIAMCEVATKYFESVGKLPDDCMPSSYYTTIIGNIRKYYVQQRMNGIGHSGKPDPVYDTFRIFETLSDNGIEPWQVEYQLETLAYMVLTGHADWNDVFLWALGNPIARTEGGNGFPPSYPCPYWLYLGMPGAPLADWKAVWISTSSPPPNTSVTPHTGVPGGNLGNQVSQAMLDAVNADPYCGGNFAPGTNTEYPQSTHGVFSMALYLHALKKIDVLTQWPQLPTCYANLHRMFVNKEAQVAGIYLHGGYAFNNRDAETFDTAKFAPNIFTTTRAR